MYFDGTTDYLLINSPPTLGANDWTFETWYYSASVPLATHNVLLSQGPGNNTIVSNFSVSSTGEIWIQTYTTSNVVLYNTAAGIINGGMWNHIVLTHDYDGSSGGTYKIYANGNQVGNVSYTSGYYWNSGGIAGTPLAMAQYRYNTQQQITHLISVIGKFQTVLPILLTSSHLPLHYLHQVHLYTSKAQTLRS